MENYGIRGRAHELIESYLSDKKQFVSVLGETSDSLPVMYGVPQGSCLRPLLFLIYINDLTNAYVNSKFILFADDTNIFVCAKSKLLVYQKANEILESVNKYMMANKLHINEGKSYYVDFTKKTTSTDTEETSADDMLELKIQNSPLKKVQEIKFLGVIIDENLNWNMHIKTLAKKLAMSSGILNRIKDNIPTTLHKDLYHTLFESHLT